MTVCTLIIYFISQHKLKKIRYSAELDIQQIQSQMNSAKSNAFATDKNQGQIEALTPLKQQIQSDFAKIDIAISLFKNTGKMNGFLNQADGESNTVLQTLNGLKSTLAPLYSSILTLESQVQKLANDAGYYSGDESIKVINQAISDLEKFKTSMNSDVLEIQNAISEFSLDDSLYSKKLKYYVSRRDFQSFVFDVGKMYASRGDLANLAQIPDLDDQLVTPTMFNELQNQVKSDFDESLYVPYASLTDLIKYIDTNNNIITTNMLSTYVRSSELPNNYIDNSTFSAQLKAWNNQINTSRTTLYQMPKHFGGVPDINIHFDQIKYIHEQTQVLQQHLNDVLATYVPDATFDTVQNQQNQQNKMSLSTLEQLKLTVVPLSIAVDNASNTYLTTAKANITYAPQNSIIPITMSLGSLPDSTMLNIVKDAYNNVFATEVSVQDTQRQISAMGNIAATYASLTDFNTLQTTFKSTQAAKAAYEAQTAKISTKF